MNKSNSLVAIITARGGSKGLPRKNLRLLQGKPLIVHTIKAALESKVFAHVLVTTDSKEIAKCASINGASVLMRPKRLARDHSSSEDAVLHALEHLEKRGELGRHFVLLQPTSPLRSAADIRNCVSKFRKQIGFRSAISVSDTPHHPYKMFLVKGARLKPVRNTRSLSTPRQSLPLTYQQNGAIYLAEVKAFRKLRTFFLEPCMPYKMPDIRSVDVDSALDIQLCELLIGRRT